MAEPITFTVPGIPIAQPRQRQRVAFMHGKAVATNYTPKRDPVNAFKAAVALSAQPHCREPWAGPVNLMVCFVLPRPKGKIWKSKPMPREHHISKPDLDNLIKATTDALKGISWRDDSQVAEMTCRKVIANGQEMAHTEITIEFLK